MPVVSVVIPTYNRASSILESVRSVLGQEFEDLEVIVVDDGSTDETLEVLGRLHDRRLRIVRCETNSGPSGARNTGIAAAHGMCIAFQDSDDLWAPSKLRLQVERMQAEPKVELVFTRFRKVLHRSSFVVPGGRDTPLEGKLLARLYRGNFIGLPTVLVRTDRLRSVGCFDENLRSLEDWDLLVRLAEQCDFGFVDAELVLSRTSVDSVNSPSAATLAAVRYIAKKHKRLQPGRSATVHTSYLEGSILIQLGALKQGRRKLREAIALQGPTLKVMAALLVSLLTPRRYAAVMNWLRSVANH